MAIRRIKEGDPLTENRRVIRVGCSFYLNLPREFIAPNNTKPGQEMSITCDHLLKVIPHTKE